MLVKFNAYFSKKDFYQRWSVLEGDDWKGLYFVEMLSLMAVCASGSLKSSLTICKVSIVIINSLVNFVGNQILSRFQ